MEVKLKFNDINVKEEKEKTLVKVLMLKGEKGDTVSAEWGTITGTLNEQTDLKNALDSKADNSAIPIIDSEINSSSTNPVQNKAIYNALADKVDTSQLSNYYQVSEVDSLLADKVDTSQLNDYCSKSDVIDNLTSTETQKPLSANQGKTLKNLIDNFESNKTIFVGDSYAAGVTNSTGVYIDSWVDYMILKMGLTTGNYYKVATPGAGFIRKGSESNMNFIESLQAIENTVTSKDTIKNIIVCGGYNDNTYTLVDIQAAITTFVNYCKINYPNATVYIGCIAYRYGNSSNDVTTKNNIQNVVYNAYANCTPSSENRTNDYVYLHGVENILKSCVKKYMYASNAHPKEDGQKALANGIYQSFMSGNCEIYQNNTGTVTPVNSGTYDGELNFTYVNEIFFIKFKKMQFNWTTGSMSLTNGSGNKIADVEANDFIGTVVPANSSISCLANIQDYTAGRFVVPATIFFDTDGSLMLYVWCTNGSGQSVTLGDIKEIILYRASTSMPAILN